MDARLLFKERHILAESAFIEMVVWILPTPLAGCRHEFKYRFALIVDGDCVLRYDNEKGKGDHKHMGEEETPYVFTSPEKLINDFWNDVDKWRF